MSPVFEICKRRWAKSPPEPPSLGQKSSSGGYHLQSRRTALRAMSGKQIDDDKAGQSEPILRVIARGAENERHPGYTRV